MKMQDEMKRRFPQAMQLAASAVKSAKTTADRAAHAAGTATATAAKILDAAVLGNDAEAVLALEAHDTIRDLARLRGEMAEEEVRPRQSGSISDAELAKLFRATGTAVWKLAGRMLDAETKAPKDEYRRLWRHVEAIRDALTDVGVDVIDFTGKRYDEGMSLKVVSEEERPGTKEPEIIETLRPTIRFRKQIQLQQGEVVVSRPSAAPSEKDAANL